MGYNKVKDNMIEMGRILEALLYKDLTLEELRDHLNVGDINLAVDLTLLLMLKYVTITKDVMIILRKTSQ